MVLDSADAKGRKAILRILRDANSFDAGRYTEFYDRVLLVTSGIQRKVCLVLELEKLSEYVYQIDVIEGNLAATDPLMTAVSQELISYIETTGCQLICSSNTRSNRVLKRFGFIADGDKLLFDLAEKRVVSDITECDSLTLEYRGELRTIPVRRSDNGSVVPVVTYVRSGENYILSRRGRRDKSGDVSELKPTTSKGVTWIEIDDRILFLLKGGSGSKGAPKRLSVPYLYIVVCAFFMLYPWLIQSGVLPQLIAPWHIDAKQCISDFSDLASESLNLRVRYEAATNVCYSVSEMLGSHTLLYLSVSLIFGVLWFRSVRD